MNEFHEDFMRDVPRGDSTRFLRQQKMPQARWMQLVEIANNQKLAYNPRLPGDKILFGALGDRLLGLSDNRHMMTVAGSRTGKSVGLIGNLFFYLGSVLATDPKGELARLTAARRVRLGQRAHVLDPFGVVSGEATAWRSSYNPLDVLAPAGPTFLEDAALIAEAIVVQAPDQKDPHWDDSARNFIEGVIVHVACAPQHTERRNLITVRDLLKRARWVDPATRAKSGDAKVLPVLLAEMLHNARRLEDEAAKTGKNALRDIGGAIEAAAQGFYSKAENEMAGVQSTIDRHTKFLDYSAMRNVLSKSDFSLRDLKANPKGVSVYLCFPATRAELSKRWMRIFVNQLLDAMEREENMPAVPVLACLDEFPVLGYMKQLETAAGLMASFGVKLWLILQDWSQGKALYGERWETFAGNCGLMQFFGNNDLATTEYLQRRLGKTQVEVMRRGEVAQDQQNQGLSGRSENIELYDLMTADEIMRQFSRDDRLKRQLVLWAGHHPMIVQRIEYFDRKGPLAAWLSESVS